MQVKGLKMDELTDHQKAQLRQFMMYSMRNEPKPEPPIVDGEPRFLNKEYMIEYALWEKKMNQKIDEYVKLMLKKDKTND